MEFQKFDIEKQDTSPQIQMKGLNRLGQSIGVIALIACVTFLVINSGGNPIESLDFQQNESSINIKVLDRSIQAVQLIQLSNNFRYKSSLLNSMFTLAQQEDKTLEHIGKLILGYMFDLLDSDNNKSVDQKEWSKFFAAVFPQDQKTFNAMFSQINKGNAFQVAHLQQFLVEGLADGSFQQIQLVTHPKVAQLALAKLVLNSDRNYQLTYTAIFSIFDLNDNKAITKEEIQNVLSSLKISNAEKVKETSDSIMTFAKQNGFCADGNNIKWAEYKSFALVIRKPLQEQLKKQSTLLKLHQVENELFLFKLHTSSAQLYQVAYSNVVTSFQSQIQGLTKQQQAIIMHLFKTITTYEFSIMDSNNDKIVTQKEKKALVDAIFMNPDDRTNYYAKLNQINAGKDFTLAQFQDFVMKKIQNPGTAAMEKYQPKENLDAIQKRAASFIVNNTRNYELTFTFAFNIFDFNGDKIISVDETTALFSSFGLKQEELKTVKDNIKKVFAQLKELGVGDGNKITLQQWTTFANQMRPSLVQALQGQITLFFFALD